MSAVEQDPTDSVTGGEVGKPAPATDQTPEGEAATVPRPAPRPPASHPENLLNWRPSPEHRTHLSDAYLAGVLSSWSREAS